MHNRVRMCEVTFKEGYIDVPLHSLQLAAPFYNCKVEILNGNHAGKVGRVLSINEPIVVKLDSGILAFIDAQDLLVLLEYE